MKARHNDQPKKFLLGQGLFLTGQKTLTNPCVIFYFYFYKETKKTKIYRYGFDCLFKNDKEHDQST